MNLKHKYSYIFTKDGDEIVNDMSFIESTFKNNQRKQASIEPNEEMNIADDISSVTNTPISTNTLFASPTQSQTPELNTKLRARIPTCTPESNLNSKKVSRTSKIIGVTTNKTERNTSETEKNPGKLSNVQYNSIGLNVNGAMKQSYEMKKASTPKKGGNRIDIMTTKPLRSKDGSFKILLGVTGTKGKDYLGDAMFNFQGDEFTYMCQFLVYHTQKLGSAKYSQQLLEAFRYNLNAIKTPGTSDSSDTNIIGGIYAKKISVGILTFDKEHTQNTIEEIVKELKNGVKSILHDDKFFTWYLIGVWLKTSFRNRIDEMTNEEISIEFDLMREACNNDVTNFFRTGSESNYLTSVAMDRYRIMEKFNKIPIFHMKDVALDTWFPESEIREIIPDLIGTYEKKYEEFVIGDISKHDDNFLFWNGS